MLQGLSPWRFLRPFLIATLLVSLLVSFLSIYFVPKCLRAMRHWQAEIGADVLTNILRPGEFNKVGALTIRVQGRQPRRLLRESSSTTSAMRPSGSISSPTAARCKKNERGYS